MPKSLGWKPDLPDHRDRRFSPKKLPRQPKEIDLRERFFKPWNQGTLGSCTAHAVGAACQFLDIYDGDMQIISPSRLFIYYNARAIEGTTSSDEGAEIRNAIKSAAKFGYPAEEKWPYRLKSFTKKPSAPIYRAAVKERLNRYERVDRNIAHFRRVLADGLPIVIGISIYESIDEDRVTKTGRIPMPSKREKLEGGHAILVVGYQDQKKQLIIRNSWGTGWGEGGYGFLPYSYIETSDLSDDFWVIKK